MKHSFKEGALVVTSISLVNAAMGSLAAGCRERGARFYVVGDRKSPPDFQLKGCDYLGLEKQRELPFAYARLCPEGSYARKNIGYLQAMKEGAGFIVETDDDNHPREDFWLDRFREVNGDCVEGEGWVNAYAYFSREFIYPRGLPLQWARDPAVVRPGRKACRAVCCPIQQGLADGDPDVDAVYRMLYPLPFQFEKAEPLVLGRGLWCPFNSQNTTFFPEAYALLYLPAFCSFRMTDIWRSFVAQRILWTCGWGVSFHNASVFQERNQHDLMRDFGDEIPGYLQNDAIRIRLAGLELGEGPEFIPDNLRACYAALIEMGAVQAGEKALLEAWLGDVGACGFRP